MIHGQEKEDTRVNFVRVFIEKAREHGRNNPAPARLDGYEAVKSMVEVSLPGETAGETKQVSRLRSIQDLAQGFCELERNPLFVSSEITYKIELGTKDRAGLVVVRFLYPRGLKAGSPPIRGFEWLIKTSEEKKSDGSIAHKILSVETHNIYLDISGLRAGDFRI